jgi:hypothetical protein
MSEIYHEDDINFKLNTLEEQVIDLQNQVEQLKRDKVMFAKIIGADRKPQFTLSNRTDR